MNVASVGRPSATVQLSFSIRVCTRVTNPMSVGNVEKHLVGAPTLSFTSAFTLGRNPMNVMSVGKRFSKNHTSVFIRELILERNPMGVMNVGEPSA